MDEVTGRRKGGDTDRSACYSVSSDLTAAVGPLSFPAHRASPKPLLEL